MILHVCKSGIVAWQESCWWFYFIFSDAGMRLIIFSSEIANCVIRLDQKEAKIIKIPYFLSNADVSNKFAKF